MNCRLEMTFDAANDLRNFADYIDEQTGDIDLAIAFVEVLKKKCKILEEFPEIGKVPRELIETDSNMRYLVHKSYIILYRYLKDKSVVQILAFFNAKRDCTWIIKQFL